MVHTRDGLRRTLRRDDSTVRLHLMIHRSAGRRTSMHLDEVPVDVDVALTERGELRERGAREVEAVGGAARAKVGHGDGDGLAGVWEK